MAPPVPMADAVVAFSLWMMPKGKDSLSWSPAWRPDLDSPPVGPSRRDDAPLELGVFWESLERLGWGALTFPANPRAVPPSSPPTEGFKVHQLAPACCLQGPPEVLGLPFASLLHDLSPSSPPWPGKAGEGWGDFP